MKSLGALIAARADSPVLRWIRGAPRTCHFVVGARDVSFVRRLLCESFESLVPMMKSESVAGFLELAAGDGGWDYRAFLARVPPTSRNRNVAAGVARVIAGMVEHHPGAFEDTGLLQLILHSIRIGRLEDARSLCDSLRALGNTRFAMEVQSYMAMYTEELSVEGRDAMLARLITAWTSTAGHAAGGLSITNESAGELTLVTGAGALSDVSSQ